MTNWIYSNSPDNKERFILGEKGDNPLVCVGVNPSTAEPNNLDPTLIHVRNRALALRYDSWFMINLYPQRATNPNDMHREMDAEIQKQNLAEIKLYLNGQYDIWVAWGGLIEKRKYLIPCLKDIYSVLGPEFRWYSIGKRSIKGHPHHPLHLSNGLGMDEFGVDSYIGGLS